MQILTSSSLFQNKAKINRLYNSITEVNVEEKQIKCDFCDDFEARSPFDIITHLKECHVENQTLKNGLQSQKRPKKGGTVRGHSTTTWTEFCHSFTGNKHKEKIPIVRLKRNLLKLVEKIPIDIYS